jgi:hypothetical protein
MYSINFYSLVCNQFDAGSDMKVDFYSDFGLVIYSVISSTWQGIVDVKSRDTHNSECENYCLLKCGSMQFGKYVAVFQRNLQPSSLG